MKRIYTLLSLIGIAMSVLTSCQKDEPTPYMGITGISFQPVNILTDNLASNQVNLPNDPSDPADSIYKREAFFTYDDPTETTYRDYKIPLVVLGYTTDYERPVTMVADTASTIAKDGYEIDSLNCYIGANATQGIINIRVKRPPLNVKRQKLVLKLLPNKYFGYVNGDGRYFTCYLSNENYKPMYWDIPWLGTTVGQTFGLYSNEKFDFIHKTLDAYTEVKDGKEIHPYRNYSTLEGFRGVNRDKDAVLQVLRDTYTQYKEDGGAPIIDPNTGKEIRFGN